MAERSDMIESSEYTETQGLAAGETIQLQVTTLPSESVVPQCTHLLSTAVMFHRPSTGSDRNSNTSLQQGNCTTSEACSDGNQALEEAS
jgi:hypothetical protein